MSSTAPSSRGFIASRPNVLDLAFAPYVLTLLFILVVYWTPGLLVPALEPLSPAQLVGGLAIFLLFAERALGRRGLDTVWPESHFMLAFLWIAALSSFDAAWMRLSVQATIDLAKITVLFFLIVNTVSDERRFRWFLSIMVIGGMVPALGTLKNYLTGNIHDGERVHWVGVFANSNDLAYSLVLLVPIAGALALTARPLGRLVLLGCTGMFLAAIFVTFSRGGLLGLLAVLGLFGLKQQQWYFRFLVIMLVLATLIFVGFFWTRDQGFADISSDATVNERLITLRAGMEMFFDRPLLGVGIAGSVAAFQDYIPPNMGFRQSLVVHNTPVMALAEVGLLGTLAFAVLIGSGLYHARFLSNSGETAGMRVLAGGVETALWGFIVCGLAGGYVMSWFPYILVAVTAAAMKIHRTEGAA